MSARAVASLIGRIIAMGVGLGPVTRLRTRALYAMLERRLYWSDTLTLSEDARSEIDFWFVCLEDFNGQPIWQDPSAVRVVYSDASNTGYGGYTVEHGTHVAIGQWTQSVAKQSSTWRELRAVSDVLEAFAPKLSQCQVKWFTDNQSVVHIIQVGSAKDHLQCLAIKIFKTAFSHSIRLEPEWVPRDSNVLADYLSRNCRL